MTDLELQARLDLTFDLEMKARFDAIGHIYLLRHRETPSLYKIGRASYGRLNSRLRRLRVPSVLQHVWSGTFFDYCEWERSLHRRYRRERLPQSEYFNLDILEVSALRRLLKRHALKGIWTCNRLKFIPGESGISVQRIIDAPPETYEPEEVAILPAEHLEYIAGFLLSYLAKRKERPDSVLSQYEVTAGTGSNETPY